MSSNLLPFLLSLLLSVIADNHAINKTIIIIHSTSSHSISTAQQLAIIHINNHANILPNYILSLQSSATATSQSYSLCDLYNNSNSIISPILLVPSWSRSDALTAILFDIHHHLLQISASSTSTSPVLSNDDTFFRTIADAELQAHALIELCKHFHWTRTGIIYSHDYYGSSLNTALYQLNNDTIEFHSFWYMNDDNIVSNMETAAEFIVGNELYITILIVDAKDSNILFDSLNRLHAIGYPYYYIGVDLWFNEDNILNNKLNEHVQGYIGIIPANPTMFSLEQHKKITNYNSTKIYNKTKYINDKIKKSIPVNDFHNPYTSYDYDTIWSLAYVLDKLDADYSLTSLLIDCNYFNHIYFAETLKRLLIDIDFIGATGKVTFNENGDRMNGLYAFGNVDQNGTIAIFGAFVNHKFAIFDDIIWPSYFNHIPWSNRKIITKRLDIDLKITIIVSICNTVVFILSLIYIVCISQKRKRLINFYGCIGILLCDICLLLNGLNNSHQHIEHMHCWVNNHTMNAISCVISVWLISIAFTLLYLPFFANKSVINDKLLAKLISYGLIGDVSVLLILTMVLAQFGLKFQLLTTQIIYTVDPMVWIQNEYLICSSSMHMSSFLIVLCWKYVQLICLRSNCISVNNKSRLKYDATRTLLQTAITKEGYDMTRIDVKKNNYVDEIQKKFHVHDKRKKHVIVVDMCAFLAVTLIGFSWLVFDNMLRSNWITKQLQYIICSMILTSLNSVWIASRWVNYLVPKH